MSTSLVQFLAAIAVVGIAIALFFGYRGYRRRNSERRMLGMLTSLGLDPTIADSGDIKMIMGEVRDRCRQCQSEDRCERWLKGEEGGDAQGVRQEAAQIEPSGVAPRPSRGAQEGRQAGHGRDLAWCLGLSLVW